MNGDFDISVVVPTYNRCELLPGAVESLLSEESNGLRYEVIVVDNNSTDKTREVVRNFSNAAHPVRYVFEPRQGNAYARNSGIKQSRAPIVAFVDDDVRASRDWLATIKRTFEQHPQVGFIGGKVLPVWRISPPAWLTSQHWMPLGLQDHGDNELLLDSIRGTGLISANLAIRRTVFERVGMFSPKVQMVKDRIGGMEDHELIDRLWRSGIIGMYVPDLVVEAPVDSERVKKKYHRRWHKGHGRNYAIMREEKMEKASWYLLGVPAPLYKQALVDSFGLLKHTVRGHEEHAFLCEVRLRFFFGFWRTRLQDGPSK